MDKYDIRDAVIGGLSFAVGILASRAFRNYFTLDTPDVSESGTLVDMPTDKAERLVQEMARTASMN